MGYIDEATISIQCNSCNIKEEVRVVDYGSNYGGSSWAWKSEFKKFKTETETTFFPKVKSAICKKCGNPAKVSTL